MGKLIIFSAPSRSTSPTIINYLLTQNLNQLFLYFGNQPSAARHGAERGGVFLSHSR